MPKSSHILILDYQVVLINHTVIIIKNDNDDNDNNYNNDKRSVNCASMLL